MRRIVSIFLSCAIILHSLSSLLVVAGYELNKGYIANQLCENKAKVRMDCKGKCHLQKQLKEQEEKEQSTGTSGKEKYESIQYYKADGSFSFLPLLLANSTNYHYQESVPCEYLASIFHPPSC